MSESSRAFQLDAPSSAAAGDGRGGKASPTGGGAIGGSVPFFRLFAFADAADAALMSLGALGAVANGAALPLMTVLFGRLIDAFGGAAATTDVVRRVSGVSLDFVYLAVASAAASFVRKCSPPTHRHRVYIHIPQLLLLISSRSAGLVPQRWRAG